MDIVSSKRNLRGTITVPGSKSHTIRALLLAALADGTSHIFNPLPSADCLSASRAIPLIGADFHSADSVWTVSGAGMSIAPSRAWPYCHSAMAAKSEASAGKMPQR